VKETGSMDTILADIKKTIEEVLGLEGVSMSGLVLFGSRAKQSFSPDVEIKEILERTEKLVA